MSVQTNNDGMQRFVKFNKTNEEKRVVYAEVYAPYTVDTWGDMMLPEEIEKMAHRFIEKGGLNKVIDTMHDYEATDSFVVESFIARAGDPDFTEGAWVLGVKVPDETLWADIKKGKLNGFSMSGFAKLLPAVAEVFINVVSIGRTEVNQEHDHLFFVELDDDGRVIRGRTSIDKNHAHEITAGTATEMAYGHAHRYFL